MKLILFLLSIANFLIANELTIEITSGKSKITIFTIQTQEECQEIINEIQAKLIQTRRFKALNINTNINKMKTMGIDMLIIVKIIDKNTLQIDIIDILQNKKIRSFQISYEKIEECINEVCNKIYETWLAEPGIFNTTFVYSTEIQPNIFIIKKKDYANNQEFIISSPISYLGNLVFANSELFFTKFYIKTHGFAVFSYDKNIRKFFLILSIKNGAVFSPAIYNDFLFFSAANEGTTGIYALPNIKQTKEFPNFKAFEAHKETIIINKIKNRIATCVNVTENLCLYTSDKLGRNVIFKHPNKAISKCDGSYFDITLFSNKKLAAIKVQDKMFHLVIIDLKTLDEKILTSKYYLGKPAWSPCGNWLAVPYRNKNEKDAVIIIHKTGKYIQTLESSFPIKSIVWINNHELD